MHELKPILLVALGGAFGSVVRYKLSVRVLHHTADWQFSAGTFAVNVIGGLVIGVLAGLTHSSSMQVNSLWAGESLYLKEPCSYLLGRPWSAISPG